MIIFKVPFWPKISKTVSQHNKYTVVFFSIFAADLYFAICGSTVQFWEYLIRLRLLTFYKLANLNSIITYWHINILHYTVMVLCYVLQFECYIDIYDLFNYTKETRNRRNTIFNISYLKHYLMIAVLFPYCSPFI